MIKAMAEIHDNLNQPGLANRYSGRVVWLYFADHLQHPFITLAAETLQAAGFAVTVVDRSAGKETTAYEHVSLGPPPAPRASRAWFRPLSAVKHMPVLFSAFIQVLRKKPSIIIFTLPQFGIIAWIASRLLRARLVYYPFELFGEQHVKVNPIQKSIEKKILRRAIDALITQNEERGEVYVKERGARVKPTIVHNYKPCYRPVATGKLRAILELPDDCRIVLYEGQLMQGRWLDNLIRSSRFLPDNSVLVFMGRKLPWWDEVAEPLLADPELAVRVRVMSHVPHAELLDYVADADVGVIIYDDKVRNNYLCAPGKLSDYILAGVPVICPDFPTIGPTIRRYAIGAVFTNPDTETIANAINEVLSRPKTAWQTALERSSRDLIWETQIPALLNAIAGR